jgi:hypothetical protein
MHERRERKKCIGEGRAINKIGLIISNILEKLSGLIIPNRRSMKDLTSPLCVSRKTLTTNLIKKMRYIT